MVGFVADRGSGIWRGGNIDDDLALKFTITVEYLNAMISAVRNVNIVLGVNRDAVRSGELTGLIAWFTP